MKSLWTKILSYAQRRGFSKSTGLDFKLNRNYEELDIIAEWSLKPGERASIEPTYEDEVEDLWYVCIEQQKESSRWINTFSFQGLNKPGEWACIEPAYEDDVEDLWHVCIE